MHTLAFREAKVWLSRSDEFNVPLDTLYMHTSAFREAKVWLSRSTEFNVPLDTLYMHTLCLQWAPLSGGPQKSNLQRPRREGWAAS